MSIGAHKGWFPSNRQERRGTTGNVFSSRIGRLDMSSTRLDLCTAEEIYLVRTVVRHFYPAPRLFEQGTPL